MKRAWRFSRGGFRTPGFIEKEITSFLSCGCFAPRWSAVLSGCAYMWFNSPTLRRTFLFSVFKNVNTAEV